MEKYRVIVSAHQLKNKVIAEFGDIVDGSQLMSDAKDLVKRGFIENHIVLDTEKEAAEKAEIEKQNAEKEAAEKSTNSKKPSKKA